MSKKRVTTLTAKQYAFCQEYIRNGYNVKQACLSAGYSEAVANAGGGKLLHNPLIQERISQSLHRAEQKLSITWEYKLNKLKRIVDEYIPDDKTVALIPEQVREGLKAIAELNKMNGDYAPDKRISMTVEATQHKLIEAKKQYSEF